MVLNDQILCVRGLWSNDNKSCSPSIIKAEIDYLDEGSPFYYASSAQWSG